MLAMSRMPGVCRGISLNAVFVLHFYDATIGWMAFCYRLRHQRIDGGTGMVLAQKKFPKKLSNHRTCQHARVSCQEQEVVTSL